MKTDELLAVLKAFNEGKRIQCKDKGIKDAKWVDVLFVGEKFRCGGTCVGNEWDTIHFDYRIKPEPHYRPFKSTEEVMDAFREHGDWVKLGNNAVTKIVFVDNNVIKLGNNSVMMYNDATKWKRLSFAFLDGTPFGKLED